MFISQMLSVKVSQGPHLISDNLYVESSRLLFGVTALGCSVKIPVFKVSAPRRALQAYYIPVHAAADGRAG